ncbi:glutamate ABC transporter substrate-binding protein [Saccharomonospora xinjiangensis]|uniref:Periplasmic component of amino acid ABC-type transporter/signal transduction system n=1 Tax=Saccharomonospora xinjiangensis XJ-54 TaxID=882086 RepID=I0V385_9PSEU|nr:glutamate ABC transporter substrate-binding protein [Saccharomonospora xinjiangensis]EID54588.1 periplasmic component of amino acid ABC-type transporter/signal transduction system [Saccharomonospora xinjiangensis XJ-54]
MTPRIRTRGAVLAALFAVVLAGCSPVTEPVDPAPVDSVSQPMPANTEIDPKFDTAGSADASCNPTASLRPDSSIPASSTMAEIKQRGHLIAGVDQNTFLFGFSDPETGELHGFDIDIAKEIARALFGDPEAVRFKAISSAERVDALAKGDVDIVVRTFSITCERLRQINFSTVYYVAGQRVLVGADSTARSLSDLGGQRVCAARDSTSLKNIANSTPRPVPVAVDDWSDCLVLLQQGQVAAVSTDDTILAGMRAQDRSGTKIIGERFTEEYYGVGIPKQNEDMVRYVNAVLEDVRDGAWQASYNRWLRQDLGAASPPKPEYR